MPMLKKSRWLVGLISVLALGLIWLVTTDHPTIWPVRNNLQYHLLIRWWGIVGEPQSPDEPGGTLEGTVYDERTNPIEGAWVLVSRWDGASYSALSSADGSYHISNIPPGTYWPVATAPGYNNVQVGERFDRLKIEAQTTTSLDVVLPTEDIRTVLAGRNLRLDDPVTLSCSRLFESQAIRQQIHFDSGEQPNQPAFYYTPVTVTTTSQLPILLAVYPGPADSWECASLPLTTAGYTVLATGPAYSFELEADIDELARLLEFARQGQFPGSDPSRIALLGGSYSSLHVQRLLQRGEPVQAALLLGPPTDLFDMRRRLEDGSYIPPFGLDKALIALGFPDRESLVYWRYSGAYHIRNDFPPLAILHSRSDNVVPYQQSELLAKNLELIGANYEAHFFDGASHYLLAEDGDSDSLKIYELTVDFLNRHMK